MTYEESYRLCETEDIFIDMVKSDAVYAMLIKNKDRLKTIEKAATIVANERQWMMPEDGINE